VCCMIGILGLLGPRALIVVWWLADTVRWTATFGGNMLWPILGLLFLPWTTIMYVLFWTTNGLDGVGWLFVILAFVADIGTYGGGAFGNRDRMQTYYK
jgi:hypothetical protein